jgi:glutamate 5-kinase
VIDIIDGKKRLIARGLSNYSSAEIQKIKGKKTDRIEAELGYNDHDEVVHKDDLVVLCEEE